MLLLLCCTLLRFLVVLSVVVVIITSIKSCTYFCVWRWCVVTRASSFWWTLYCVKHHAVLHVVLCEAPCTLYHVVLCEAPCCPTRCTVWGALYVVPCCTVWGALLSYTLYCVRRPVRCTMLYCVKRLAVRDSASLSPTTLRILASSSLARLYAASFSQWVSEWVSEGKWVNLCSAQRRRETDRIWGARGGVERFNELQRPFYLSIFIFIRPITDNLNAIRHAVGQDSETKSTEHCPRYKQSTVI